ncbi:MAG TPA: RluA family pseudouridine synthase [Candidatus Merdenecus merdavium]|nr:RluA family pseudouridine synthase [Candidatus Merdenecus merdavium]
MSQDREVSLNKYLVEEEYQGERLDKYLSLKFPKLSRSYIQKLVKDHQVSVDGKNQKVGFKLSSKEEVIISIPEEIDTEVLPEDLPLDILYEDEDLLIVNKPKGMVVHPGAGHSSGTLVNALLYYAQQGSFSLSTINGEIRPGIVHRIDMDTTGALIVCKKDDIHIDVAKQLEEHTITRKYRAIVYGTFKEKKGTICGPIGRHPIDRKKMAINEKNGKPAVTHYEVLKDLEGYSYIECQLETGRTHQIRVHMTSIQHPLLGDAIYGPKKSPFKLQGQTLHAMEIGFVHPRTKEYIEFQAPLPEYFKDLIHKLGK